MVLLYIIVTVLALSVSGQDYTPEPSDYIFNPLLPILDQLNVIDGIPITNLTTTPTSNRLPTRTQMKYYVYYTAVNWYYDLIEDFNCTYCLKIKPDIADYEVIFNGTYDTLAMVALSHTRKEIVVAFRGTSNPMNVVLDFVFLMNIRVNDTSNIKVHTGCYLATMSVYYRVVKAVAGYRKDNPTYKIVITGLSLGGAMARLTCFFFNDLKQFPGAVYELYTFGEFRVGNIPFAEYMNSLIMTSVRVVHRADLVPHFPPVNILGLPLLYDHYVHCQTEYWIHDTEEEFACQKTYEDPECSISVGPAYTLVDHFEYFDVNIASAFAQPLQLASIGFNILPVELIIPPLPKYIENPFGNILDGAIGAILPVLG